MTLPDVSYFDSTPGPVISASRLFAWRPSVMLGTVRPFETESELVEVSAFFPEKEAWKNAGNRFTAGQLHEMERQAGDLVILADEEPVYDAD